MTTLTLSVTAPAACHVADAGGHARVADMGLSRRLEPGAAANLTGETGTYFYMAPEVFRHEVRCICSHGILIKRYLTTGFRTLSDTDITAIPAIIHFKSKLHDRH